MQINDFALFDYLSPRLQKLLYEAKKFKNEKLMISSSAGQREVLSFYARRTPSG